MRICNEKEYPRTRVLLLFWTVEDDDIGDSLDWKDLSASEITKRVTEKVRSGSICLFHNAALHTPEALPAILQFFQENGYKVVPISEILLQGDYYMDHTGKQCPSEE